MMAEMMRTRSLQDKCLSFQLPGLFHFPNFLPQFLWEQIIKIPPHFFYQLFNLPISSANSLVLGPKQAQQITRKVFSQWLFNRPIRAHTRVVKKFLSTRLVMAGRQLWNSHQRHKLLRDQASRNILQFRISKMAFSGVFKRYFPLRMPCFFVKIHATLGTMPLKCPTQSTTSHSSNVPHI